MKIIKPLSYKLPPAFLKIYKVLFFFQLILSFSIIIMFAGSSRLVLGAARRARSSSILFQNKRAASSSSATDTLPTLDSDEHVMLRSTVKRFVEEEINPNMDSWEAAGIFPAHEVFKKAANLGILGLNKPEEYGGSGLDFTYNLVAAEEMGGSHGGSVPMAMGVQTDMATPALARFGSQEVKENFLAPSIAGDFVACLGVSEVGAGSDVANIKTTARKDGDDYIIDGGKMWTTNGTQADWMCLLANTSDGGGNPYKNKSLICVPMDADGVEIARQIDKMGMRASDTAQVFLDGVRVPQKYIIGKEGDGFKYQMLQFQEERLYCAAVSLKSLELCIEKTAEYCASRNVFGKPVLDNQVVQYRLAELQTEVEALRAMTYRACLLHVQGKEDVTLLASMCKLKVGRLSRELTDACLQYWGGMGFTNEVIISRIHRDLRLNSIGGGADEVMLSVISRMLGFASK